MPVFVSFARFMNRTYSAVIPCICSHLPHHRIESRFDTIPDKSLDCKRFFHFCVIFCAPLHNYPKSTNNTRYKPAILLRGRGRVDWRRATPGLRIVFSCARQSRRKARTHRPHTGGALRRAGGAKRPARTRTGPAGICARADRRGVLSYSEFPATAHPLRFRVHFRPAARSRTPPAALSAALPLRMRPS